MLRMAFGYLEGCVIGGGVFPLWFILFWSGLFCVVLCIKLSYTDVTIPP